MVVGFGQDLLMSSQKVVVREVGVVCQDGMRGGPEVVGVRARFLGDGVVAAV